VPRRKQPTSLLTLLIVIAVSLAWAAYKKYYRDAAPREGGGRTTTTTTTAPRAPSVPPGSPAANLLAGNPSGATADPSKPDNYLMERPGYAISYNRSKGTANWVSWRLDASDLGAAERQNDFRPDDALPAGWYHVTPSDYT
jgi:endonuclease G